MSLTATVCDEQLRDEGISLRVGNWRGGSHGDDLMIAEVIALGTKGKCFCKINFMLSKEEESEWLKKKIDGLTKSW